MHGYKLVKNKGGRIPLVTIAALLRFPLPLLLGLRPKTRDNLSQFTTPSGLLRSP